MNAFGTELEATVRILRYDPNDNFIYEELEDISQNDANKVRFSILINVKQKGHIESGSISIFFTHGYKKSGSAPTRQRSIHIGDIDLTTRADSDAMHTCNGLSRDPWTVRQTFRINFASVPTEGPDDYAIVLRVPTEADPRKYRILDCAYLKITESMPDSNNLGR